MTPKAYAIRIGKENGYTWEEFKKLCLSGADLSSLDLSNTNLVGINLFATNLRNSSLAGSNLEGAILDRTTAIHANFANANLKNATLEDTILSGANLDGTNLIGANIKNTNFSGVNLENTILDLSDVPKITDINSRILDIIRKKGINPKRLKDPFCINWEELTIKAAGKRGKELADKIGVRTAASLIYAKAGSHPVPIWTTYKNKTIEELKIRATKEERCPF